MLNSVLNWTIKTKEELVPLLKKNYSNELYLMSLALQKKIENNYRFIMTFNSALILAGLLSLITPASAAYLHNISTLLVSAAATRPLKKEEKKLQLNIS